MNEYSVQINNGRIYSFMADTWQIEGYTVLGEEEVTEMICFYRERVEVELVKAFRKDAVDSVAKMEYTYYQGDMR